MKKILIYGSLALLLCSGLIPASLAQERQKLAQTGFQFLIVVSDAGAAGLGCAVNSVLFGSSSLFFNPAGMANLRGFIDVAASDNQWIADIHHNTVSLAINPRRGRYGVLGVTFQTVDYGDKNYGTIVANNAAGYLDTEELSPAAYAIGVGYAKALSDRFAVGGQIRWVTQDFGELTIPLSDTSTESKSYSLTPLAFDFGTQFKTGFKSLTFGMSVRNFSQEIKYEKEGFQLPLVFTLGINANLMELFNLNSSVHAAILSLDARHDRSHAEQLLVGFDYRLLNVLSLRTGYTSNNDENSLSWGVGIAWYGVTLDYAYAPYGIFNHVQRITARFAF